jgi:hypothetical protein
VPPYWCHQQATDRADGSADVADHTTDGGRDRVVGGAMVAPTVLTAPPT